MNSTQSPPPLPSRDEVLAACKQSYYLSNGEPFGDNIWIKYGGDTTLAEAAMQCFIRQNADPSLVRVPAVYDCFIHHRSGQCTATFIVMEKVDGETFAEFRKNHPDEADSKIQAIIDAVRHIWTIPVPSGASPGPLGGKTPDDRFFASDGAGQDFDNVAQLEDWVNEKLVYRNKPERASFRSEKLQVCHCNLSQRNIMVDGSKKSPLLTNWSFSGLYPRVFEEYALVQNFHGREQGGKFAKELHKKLFGLKLSTNMRPLSLVAAMNEWGPFCI